MITGSHHILVMWWNHFSLLFSVHGVNYLRQTKIHTPQPIGPEVNAFEVEMVTETVRSHITRYLSNPSSIDKGTGVEQFTEIHKHIYSIWNKKDLLEERKESIILPIYKKADKTDCRNYRGISLLSATYKILSYILLSRLTPNAEQILEDHHCVFGCNRSTGDHTCILCINQMQQKKMRIQ